MFLKTVFLGLVLSFSGSGVFASDQPAASLPDHLECRDLQGDLGVFHVIDLSKGGSDLWIDRDARGESLTVGRLVTEIIAHNGCDNYYELQFMTWGLQGLKRGKRAAVIGKLKYYNADNASEASDVMTIETMVECVDYTPVPDNG